MMRNHLFSLFIFSFLSFSTSFAVQWNRGLDESDVLEAAKGFTSVVEITTSQGIGSGVIIGPRTVLTAAHVVEGVDAYNIRIKAESDNGDRAYYRVKGVYLPDGRGAPLFMQRGAEFDLFVADIAIVELVSSIDIDRFSIENLDFEGTAIGSCYEDSHAVRLEGVGYGMSGRYGLPLRENDGKRRYYEMNGFAMRSDEESSECDLWARSDLRGYRGSSSLRFEGMAQPGDSGSPAFVRDPYTGKIIVEAIVVGVTDANILHELDLFLDECQSSICHEFSESLATRGIGLMVLTPIVEYSDWIRTIQTRIEGSESGEGRPFVDFDSLRLVAEKLSEEISKEYSVSGRF